MFSLLYYPAILAHEGFLVKGYFQKFAASRRGQCVTNLVRHRYTSEYSLWYDCPRQSLEFMIRCAEHHARFVTQRTIDLLS